MSSGLTWTRWPIVSAASWPSVVALGTLPENVGSGSCHFAPMPKAPTTWRKAELLSRRDRPANAVLQPWAKSLAKVGLGPSDEESCCSLKSWPPTLAVLVHGTWVLVENPVPSRAAVDTMVNAFPGEMRAFRAPP